MTVHHTSFLTDSCTCAHCNAVVDPEIPHVTGDLDTVVLALYHAGITSARLFEPIALYQHIDRALSSVKHTQKSPNAPETFAGCPESFTKMLALKLGKRKLARISLWSMTAAVLYVTPLLQQCARLQSIHIVSTVPVQACRCLR